MAAIGDQLRYARVAKGIGVSVLAEQTGITRVGIYAIENGNTKHPSFESVARIAKAVGISLDALAFDEYGAGI